LNCSRQTSLLGYYAHCPFTPISTIICWMTWLIQPEGKMIRMEKYSKILPKI
jgi:hypothetical protein